MPTPRLSLGCLSSNGIEEMARTVAHMDELTQQNALLADQSAKVAHELQRDTAALNDMVASFTLDDAAGQGFAARVASEIRQQAPHLARVPAPAPRFSAPAATRPTRSQVPPRRLAVGGDASGWSEF